MSLKTVKNKIRSVEKTGQVTKAMEAVSAVKMRKSQERALLGRPYAAAAFNILERVSGSLGKVNHILTEKRDVKNICFVVVTSDKGLAGNLNNAVLKKTVEEIEKEKYQKDQIHFFCFGRKVHDFFSKRGYNILANYDNISDEISIEDMRETTESLVEMYKNKDFDKCYIVYTNFKSTFEQDAVMRRLIPLSVGALVDTIRVIRPEYGKYASENGNGNGDTVIHTVEPSHEEVLSELIPFLLNIEVYHALLEAKASEHSARMVAMKNASDKARDLSKELNLEFNKARQAMITKEMSEITSGMVS
jgi:F-type H+-transporting ATPase subunit gamma